MFILYIFLLCKTDWIANNTLTECVVVCENECHIPKTLPEYFLMCIVFRNLYWSFQLGTIQIAKCICLNVAFTCNFDIETISSLITHAVYCHHYIPVKMLH